MTTTMFHNPRCSKSRQTLELLNENGVHPEIVKYLENPPTIEELKEIRDMLGIGPRELMRKGEAEYKAQGLADENLSDEELITAMVKTPRLIERPIVIKNGRAALGRPPVSVLDIL